MTEANKVLLGFWHQWLETKKQLVELDEGIYRQATIHLCLLPWID